MASKKHYVIVSVTLGCIAMASAILIGATNLLTADRIAKNKDKKITDGITEIFGEIDIPKSINLKGYDYVTKYYDLNENRYAFITEGSNMYGKVSLVIGFEEIEFKKLAIITNDQTYASTLEENYISSINADSTKMDDVDCGATYGATLVRNMINDAKKAAEDLLGK